MRTWLLIAGLLFGIHAVSADKTRLQGDLNADGKTSMNDVIALIKVLHGEVKTTRWSDVNQDGKTNMVDLRLLVDIVLGKVKPLTLKDGSGFSDSDQTVPGKDDSDKSNHSDADQQGPGIEGGGGGFSDDDMKNPLL